MSNIKKLSIKYLFLIGLSFIVLGTSYAFFNYTSISENNVSKAGDVYLYYDDQDTIYINASNTFPLTYEEAIAKTDNTMTFKVKAINTSNIYGLQYNISLINGRNISGKTRINDQYLKFELLDITNPSNPRTVISNQSFSTINNSLIETGIIPKNTNSEVVKTYKLRVWVSDSVLISDTDPNSTHKATEDPGINSTKPLYSNLFASIKIKIDAFDIMNTN